MKNAVLPRAEGVRDPPRAFVSPTFYHRFNKNLNIRSSKQTKKRVTKYSRFSEIRVKGKRPEGDLGTPGNKSEKITADVLVFISGAVALTDLAKRKKE